MSYAVVRFLNEGSTNDVIVSEVPISWLSEDHMECKWPPNNCNIYISKNRPASDSWPSYPVEVEFICGELLFHYLNFQLIFFYDLDTLADAKLKTRSCSSQNR